MQERVASQLAAALRVQVWVKGLAADSAVDFKRVDVNPSQLNFTRVWGTKVASLV